MDKKRILLVEDEALVRETIAMSLSKSGFEVVTDTDGLKAVERAVQEHPNVVLLDIRLPGKDGITILQEIKQRPATQQIPVLILTNLTDQRVMSETVALGARGYFVKSDMSFGDVVRKVQEILEG